MTEREALRTVQEKLGWLLFNLGKCKTDAAYNICVNALAVIDEVLETEYAEGWRP